MIAAMTDTVETAQARKYQIARMILLLLAVFSSPLWCCGCAFVLDTLPAPFQIPMMDLFEAEATVENRSGETLYLTPITTTYGYPLVIGQSASIRQRDFALDPGRTIVLTYDSADAPLAGIVVCRMDNDCRLLAVDHSDLYYLDSFEELTELQPDWLSAVSSHPQYSFRVPVFVLLSFLPVALLSGWVYLTWREKSNQRSGIE
jgi:hypothetical protein